MASARFSRRSFAYFADDESLSLSLSISFFILRHLAKIIKSFFFSQLLLLPASYKLGQLGLSLARKQQTLTFFLLNSLNSRPVLF